MSLHNSKSIFEAAGIVNRCCQTRSTALNKLGKTVKPKARPPISHRNKQKRVFWAEKYMKVDFSKVIFTDECCATLDWPDSWIIEGESIPVRLRRQQGARGVMFWARIVGNKLIGPFRVSERVKLDSQFYVKFLSDNFFAWYKSQSRSFKMKCIFMHDNAPAHASRLTAEFLAPKSFKEDRLMQWPPSSPNLNCIENLWSTIKGDVSWLW